MFGKNANTDLREMMQGIKSYEVAYTIGITPYTFSRWLSMPMNDERRKRTVKAIREVRKNERSGR